MNLYCDYKDSGLPWIGRIPSHWQLERAKWSFKIRNERGNQELVLLAATQKNGMYPQEKVEGVVKVAYGTDLQQFKTVHKGDFVISLRSFQGGFERSDYEGVCSPAYQVFFADPAVWHNDYLKFLFKDVHFIDAMNALTVGIREGRNIKYEDFANSQLAIPPYDEQVAIATFLLRQTQEIDAVITEAKVSIEEYKAWKASIIYEAVTKGINPTADMKNSGVRWIGKMPSSWKRTKISRCFTKIGSGTTPNSDDDTLYSGDISWLQSGDINGGIVGETKKQISLIAFEEYSALKMYLAPFIAIAMYGASIANTSIVNIDACTNQACCVLSDPKEFVNLQFVYYSILAAKTELLLQGRGGTQPNISQDIIRNLIIPIPPLDEQIAISKKLSKKCDMIDTLIDEKQALITELESYKKSLIFEAVTGKRKVC